MVEKGDEKRNLVAEGMEAGDCRGPGGAGWDRKATEEERHRVT